MQDFKLRGGGAHLKKWRRAEGGAKNVGVFRVKNHDFTPKNNIFTNFKGGVPPWHITCDRSLIYKYQHNTMVVFVLDGTHLVERLGLWCFTQLLYFSYIVVSFIGGGSWSTPSKPPICRKSLTNFYHIMLQRIHLARCGNSNSQRYWW